MRRALVHVGLPRTGTTSLQRVLCSLRPSLLTAGVLYPDLTPRSAAEPHLSHQHLGEALDGRRPRSDRADLLGKLAHQLATTQADTVIISYEGLCLAPAWMRVPQRLAALLGQHGFAMDVVATIKPQAELVNSAYTWRTQFLREGRPFPAYFKAEIGSASLDLGRLLRPWRAACSGRMVAVPTRAPRTDRPLVERVLEETGLLPRVAGMLAPQDRTLVDNRSPGPVVVEIARRLRRGGAHLALGRDAREAVRFVEAAAGARGVNDVPFTGLDAASRAAAVERWQAANDRFAQTVWGEPWAARVAHQPDSPSNDILQRDDPAEAELLVAEIIALTCDRYRLRLDRGMSLAMRDAIAAAGARLDRLLRYSRAMTP